WNMIASGSTISMEAWDMKYKPNSDWNHAWGAVPANIIPRHLWGIQPTLPGFEECTIKPQMSQLTSSKIKVPTIRGSIFGEYKKDENKGTFTIEIPGNMGAKFNCSSLHYKEVRLNGRQINESNGLILLSSGGNKLEFFY
ncbi:MAG: acetylglucosamine-6-sulfatase, partial [Cyclobacteriaceae bacterium]|nr:acetylglucosamine-6-sulfatase [Cyclobacteriaceae bacterium]